MKFLYVRVSTKGQKTERQEVLKDKYNADEIYIDKCSGKDTNRPQLKEMFKKLRAGDTVIVESYSRFSRSTKDLLSLVDKLNEKKVNFISIKENLDTTTPQGRLMLTMFAGLYQFERECMLERQKEGIEIAKQNGSYKNVGRKKITANDKIFETLYNQWKSGEIKANDFMQALNLKRNTFYRRVKEYEDTLTPPAFSPNSGNKVVNIKDIDFINDFNWAQHAYYCNNSSCPKCGDKLLIQYKHPKDRDRIYCYNDDCTYMEDVKILG